MSKVPSTKQPAIFSSLVGHFLVAAPHMNDERFFQTVIYMCQHDAEGAMGLIVNKPMEGLNFAALSTSLDIGAPRNDPERPIFTGGPVESKRGYILHSQDQMMPETISITETVALSLQIDMLNDIALGLGPTQLKIMLGYTGWDSGQLENEMREGIWFHLPAQDALLFDAQTDHLWESVFQLAGFDAGALSAQSGNA